jgi:isopenicillin N synthase-like dioxygenase
MQVVDSVHYEWLEKGRPDAQLSDAASLQDVPRMSLRCLDGRKLVAGLQKHGVVLLDGHKDAWRDAMFREMETFFELPQQAKMSLAKTPEPGPALLYRPVRSGANDAPTLTASSPPGVPPRSPAEGPMRHRSPSPVRNGEAPLVKKAERSPSPTLRAKKGPSPVEMPVVARKTRIAYTPPRHEQLNPVMRADVKETFDYALDVKSTGETHLGKNRMPNIPNFEALASEYIRENVALARVLLRAIASGLGLAETAFDAHFEEPMAIQVRRRSVHLFDLLTSSVASVCCDIRRRIRRRRSRWERRRMSTMEPSLCCATICRAWRCTMRERGTLCTVPRSA